MDALQLPRKTALLIASGLLLATAGMADDLLVDNNNVAINFTTPVQTVRVTSASGNTPFTIGRITYDQPYTWLSVTSDTLTTPATLTLTFNYTPPFAGPFTAHFSVIPSNGGASQTINVTFVPSTGGGTSATPVTPSQLSVSAASGATVTNTLVLQNTTANAVSLTVSTSTSDGGGWLTASVDSATVAGGGTSFISVSTSAVGLANGTYNGAIRISVSPGQPVTVSVTFTVGATGLVVSSQNIGLSFPATNSPQITVSGVSSYNATASTTTGGNWILMSAGGQASTATISNVSASNPLIVTAGQAAASLITGTYQGTIVLTGSNNAQATINVTLAVNTASGGQGLIVSPTSLSFAYQTAGPAVPSQTIAITSPASTIYNAQVDVPWLALSGPQGDVPGQIQVYVTIPTGGFTPNTYTGHVTINDGSLTTTVPVSLVASDSPILTATLPNGTGTLLFTSLGSVASPASQTVALAASDGSAISPSIVSAPSWATVTLNGNTLTVTPNVSGLGGALYSDNIVVSANSLANSPLSIPIVLIANGGGNAGPLTFSQSSFTFQGTVGGAAPAAQSLTVTPATGTTFNASTNGAWLTISPSGSFATATTFTVSVSPAGLTAGTYNGSIQFNANGVIQAVPVTFVLTGTGGGGNVTSSPSSLSLTAQFSGTAQTASLTISNAASGTAGIVYTVSTSASWLKASPAQATTQSTVTVTADASGLAPGSYQGQVTITPTGGTALNVPVTLTVQALPTISVSSSSLTFTYRSGGATPAAQSVTASGGAFTTQVTSDGNFLAVTPTSGNATTSLSVSVTPTGLSIGTHTGTITVSGTNGVTGQAVVNITLTVTAPLPTVTALLNGASFIQGPISPGEVITLTGTDLGPATPATAQIDATGKLATQLGSVQVLVNGFLAPMIYASATQVSAVVPYEIANYTTAITQVKYLGQSSNAVSLPVNAAAPGIFTQNSSGSGPGAYNADFSLNGPNNPVAKGGSVVFFLTGEGQLTPAGVTGTINGANPAAPVQRANVLIDGQGANYTYAAGITGVVEGIMQLNVQIPADARSGDLPVVVSIGGKSTQNGVTVSVK